MLHNDLEFLRQVVVGMSENFKETSKRWRIYCLTPLPDSTLMWSHYAENHRGICLEFAVDNEIFGNAREVAYRSEYPCWLPHDPPDEGMIEVLLTKSDDWKYEKEFRIVARASTVNAELPTLPGEHYLALPAGALRSVIIGCQGDFEAISILVAKKAPGLPVRRAVRTPNHYRLKIEPA